VVWLSVRMHVCLIECFACAHACVLECFACVLVFLVEAPIVCSCKCIVAVIRLDIFCVSHTF
jgi:hypothetical protein